MERVINESSVLELTIFDVIKTLDSDHFSNLSYIIMFDIDATLYSEEIEFDDCDDETWGMLPVLHLGTGETIQGYKPISKYLRKYANKAAYCINFYQYTLLHNGRKSMLSFNERQYEWAAEERTRKVNAMKYQKVITELMSSIPMSEFNVNDSGEFSEFINKYFPKFIELMHSKKMLKPGVTYEGVRVYEFEPEWRNIFISSSLSIGHDGGKVDRYCSLDACLPNSISRTIKDIPVNMVVMMLVVIKFGCVVQSYTKNITIQCDISNFISVLKMSNIKYKPTEMLSVTFMHSRKEEISFKIS